MLSIEKGGPEQIKDELEAYNPLIPKGKQLSANTKLTNHPLSANSVCSRNTYV